MNMGTNTGARVIITDLDDSDFITGTFGKAFEIIGLGSQVVFDEFFPNRHVGFNNGVYATFNFRYFNFSQNTIKMIIAL
jgi:hypothetical protein